MQGPSGWEGGPVEGNKRVISQRVRVRVTSCMVPLGLKHSQQGSEGTFFVNSHLELKGPFGMHLAEIRALHGSMLAVKEDAALVSNVLRSVDVVAWTLMINIGVVQKL